MKSRPLVIKFGGTSVGDGARISRAARIAAEAARKRPTAVVVSAMAGTTDALLGFARITTGPTTDATRTTIGATREGSVAELYRSLAERHLEAARVAVSEEHLPEVEQRLLCLLKQLVKVVNEPFAGSPSEARRDAVASFGERLSAVILAGAVRSLGAPAAVVAEDPIATDASFGEAEVLVGETRERCSGYVRPILDGSAVAVVPGFVGRAPDGSVTTLGRGGSDLSATVLGRALGSEEVWILSDVDGVLSADPRLVPEPALIPRLSYREAARLASLGAKVLHPRTTEPAAAAGIEVRVGSTFNPDSPGTRVSDREGGSGIRGFALRRDLRLNHASPGARDEDFLCALGADADGLLVLADGGMDGDVAGLFGVGAPTDGDLLAGLRCLREVGIRPRWAGNARAGLLFVVAGDEADGALRVLHDGLVPANAATGIVEVA